MKAEAPGYPSHGIVLTIWYDDLEPQLSYLPPGVSLSTQVPLGSLVRKIEVGSWKPSPPWEYEQGWCTRCGTPCGREKGTETWYNFYGRSECKLADQDGIPHDMITGDAAQPFLNIWENASG